jgi:hypothetical protein
MKQNWFYRKSSIKKLRIYALIILGVVFFTEYFIVLHPHFDIAKIFGFHAVYGFLSCVGLIIFAKLLGFLVKRKDDYYDV